MTNQQQAIFNVLRDRAGEWVPLPEILKLGIAQYGARLLELRRMGYAIENKTIEIINGQRHTAFRLVAQKPTQGTFGFTQSKVTNARLAA